MPVIFAVTGGKCKFNLWPKTDRIPFNHKWEVVAADVRSMASL